LEIRREVLGAEYVDAALADATAFSKPMQDLVTEYCWGWLWSRKGVPRNVRSLINLALLGVLNRPVEFKAHVRGALHNGCTAEEIAEVLLQVAVYAGVPAGVEAFRLANEALKAEGVELNALG
jgi:4-carboxymuconolactone decarboxylase